MWANEEEKGDQIEMILFFFFSLRLSFSSCSIKFNVEWNVECIFIRFCLIRSFFSSASSSHSLHQHWLSVCHICFLRNDKFNQNCNNMRYYTSLNLTRLTHSSPFLPQFLTNPFVNVLSRIEKWTHIIKNQCESLCVYDFSTENKKTTNKVSIPRYKTNERKGINIQALPT